MTILLFVEWLMHHFWIFITLFKTEEIYYDEEQKLQRESRIRNPPPKQKNKEKTIEKKREG